MLQRTISAIHTDARLQLRNGFYAAAGFVLAILAIGLSQLPMVDLAWLLPAVLLNHLVVGTFFFIAGLVLLEKAEGSIKAVAVTPLRPTEYLNAKLLTLGGLALGEHLLLVVLFSGARFALLPLVAGLLLAAALFILLGFVLVVRYASLNEFLLPAVGYTSLLLFPGIAHAAGISHWLLYLHPTQALVVLLRAAFQPVPALELAYGLGYGLLAVAGAYWLALRAFTGLHTDV